MREATSLVLINKILSEGGKVIAYDPVAMPEAARRLGDKIEFAHDIYHAVDGVDALIVVTEWKEFRLPAWNTIKKLMKFPVVLDGRNIYEKSDLADYGFAYYSIGRI
jgi:UDPglucose 6-dehydrogenase